MAQTILAQIKQYSQADTDWNIIHPATSGTIVSLGKAITVEGHNIGSYTVGSQIPADASVAAVIEQIAKGDETEVTWAGITGKPTSEVADIDTAVAMANRFAESGGTLTFDSKQVAYVTDIPTTYDATKITGTINIANLPAAAVERLYIAENDAARLALTTTEVQNGDTVKVADSGLMYFVKDDTKLGTAEVADAFEEYTVGSASSVAWSGVTGTPTTLAGYGITDAVNVANVSDTAVAGKVVKYTAEGKLAGTAANADQLGGQDPSYYATATDMDSVKSGEGITALAASKLTGTVSRDNLPADVSGKAVQVLDQAAMLALTTSDINRGDVVVQTSTGKVYMFNDVENVGTIDGFQLLVDVTAADIAWEKITGKPTTLEGYGITDAATAESVTNLTTRVDTAETDIANLKSGDAIVALDATKLSGTVKIENLPASVVERLSIVADEEALLALTTETVQNGDSVKVTATGKMYFVKDDTKLGQMEAFEEYSVGSAASVPWSGVTGTPTTLAGYGITDAVNVSEVATTGANKVLKTNANGKIEVDTTGAAASVPFTGVTGLHASVTADALKQAVADDHTHANKDVLDKVTESAGAVFYDSKELAYKDDVMTLAQIPVLEEAPESPVAGQMYFQVITGA